MFDPLTRIDVVLITRDRPQLTEQCIRSLFTNAAQSGGIQLVVVYDGSHEDMLTFSRSTAGMRDCYDRFGSWIETGTQIGVGGAKNVGARKINPSPERAKYIGDNLLMFLDNDMFLLPEWDAKLEYAMSAHTNTPTQLGGWRHPYHQLGRNVGGFPTPEGVQGVREVDAVTGNCFVIRWSDWLRYGPFDSNAIGPGQSEDYALSQRIKAGGGLVATLDPPVAIHCGLVNSIGEPATGWRECETQITEQLAALSAEMRESVLIMRPAPTRGQIPMLAGRSILVGPKGPELTIERIELNRTVTEAGLQPGPVVSSQYSPGRAYLGARRFVEEGDANRVFDSARAGLDMQPRAIDPIVPVRKPDGIIPHREITVDEARDRYPHPSRSRRLHGLNIGSGQRRFESVPSVFWLNVDVVRRPPDQIPDVIADARELDRYFELDSKDYVVSHHLHEHLGHGEADPITQAAYHVLRPGGSLFVFTPDARKLAGRWLGGELDDFQFAVQMMGAYQGLESDRHRWLYTQETLIDSLANAAPWREVKPFDWREIGGMNAARDWYIAAVECVK